MLRKPGRLGAGAGRARRGQGRDRQLELSATQRPVHLRAQLYARRLRKPAGG